MKNRKGKPYKHHADKPNLNIIKKKSRQEVQQERMEKVMSLMPRAYIFLFPVIMGICLYVFENETLYEAQEFSLFLNGALFFRQLAVVPGGVLEWAACWMTQMFYYPVLGVSLLVVLWILTAWLMRETFKIGSDWAFLLFIVPAGLLGGVVEPGYLMFLLKLPGYYFVASIGILIAVAAVWAYLRLSRLSYWAALVWMLAWTAVGYVLCGAYGLAASLCMLILMIRVPDVERQQRAIAVVVGILAILAVPLLLWRVYEQANIQCLYMAALPSFSFWRVLYPQFRVPFYFVLITPVVASLLYNTKFKLKQCGPWIHLIAIVVAGLGLYRIWYTDENFRIELKMKRAIENEEWEKVPVLFNSTDNEPTRLMVMNKNLALFRMGRAGDEMYHYREGGKRPAAPDSMTVRLIHVGGKMLYFHYGQENYCYRWCMEDGVTLGWKVVYLKYMTKACIANGDLKVARKYINLLKRTAFQKEWAERYERYLEHPETIRESTEFGPVLHMMPADNILTSDLNVIEMYLLKNFAYDMSEDPIYQEQSLISAMQMKDIQLFWPRFNHYARLHRGQRMPKHYQEAAILYGNLEKGVDISHMPFDADVRQSFNEFMDLTRRYGNLPESELAEMFRPRFGNTFYYFYFLVNNIPTY